MLSSVPTWQRDHEKSFRGLSVSLQNRENKTGSPVTFSCWRPKDGEGCVTFRISYLSMVGLGACNFRQLCSSLALQEVVAEESGSYGGREAPF